MTKQISQIIYEVELERPLDDSWYEACQEIKHRITEAMGWRKYPEQRPEKEGFYFVVWAKDQHQTYYGHSHFDGKRFTERSSFISPLAFMEIQPYIPELPGGS